MRRSKLPTPCSNMGSRSDFVWSTVNVGCSDREYHASMDTGCKDE